MVPARGWRDHWRVSRRRSTRVGGGTLLIELTPHRNRNLRWLSANRSIIDGAITDANAAKDRPPCSPCLAQTNQHLRGEIGNAARTVLDAIEIAHDLSHLVESRFHNEHSDWVRGVRKLTKKAREM